MNFSIWWYAGSIFLPHPSPLGCLQAHNRWLPHRFILAFCWFSHHFPPNNSLVKHWSLYWSQALIPVLPLVGVSLDIAAWKCKKCLDLPQVDLFLNLDLFISLEQSERVIFVQRSCEGEREQCKSWEVDLFHLQECELERKFLVRKTWLTFRTSHVLRARLSQKQKMIAIKMFTSAVP